MPHAPSLRPDSACDTLPETFRHAREYSRAVSRPTRADINLDALRHNAAQVASRLRNGAKLLAVLKADAYGHGAVEIARALTQTTSREDSQNEACPESGIENTLREYSQNGAGNGIGSDLRGATNEVSFGKEARDGNRNANAPREYSQRDFSSSCVAMLGVASVDEGAELRDAKITAPILLLSAILPEEAEVAVAFGLMPTIFSEELARACNNAAKARGKVADFHFKIDTGMNRLGANYRDASKLLQKLREYSHLHLSGVYTHFACADEQGETMTRAQCGIFRKTLAECGLNDQATSSRPLIHAANSAAAMRFSDLHFDLARAGIALYGVDPRENSEREYSLRPVMTLRSRVTHVREIAAGETVSYGATWRAEKPTRLAIVPVGYADGYPRRAGGRAAVLIGGARCEVAGRITMDQIIVDCSRAPEVRVGDNAIIFGESSPAQARDASTRARVRREPASENETMPPSEAVSVSEIAAWAQTIPYEVLCGIAPRVPRILVRDAIIANGIGDNAIGENVPRDEAESEGGAT